MRCAKTGTTSGLMSSGMQNMRPSKKCHGLRGTIESLRSARRNAKRQKFGFAGAAHDFERVANQRIVHSDLLHCLLHFQHFRAGENRAKFVQVRNARLRAQNLALGLSVGISHAHAHQEAVELRFRQRIGSVMLDRILGRDHEERLRQFIRVRVDRDLAFVHRFEQRGLRLGRRAVDFVGQQHVGENRAALEFKFLLRGRINRNAHHVGGQQVAGELHALKRAVDGASKRLSESGLADARNAFNEQVPAGEDADQREADDIVFAANDAAQGRFKFSGFMRYGSGSFQGDIGWILLFGDCEV